MLKIALSIPVIPELRGSHGGRVPLGGFWEFQGNMKGFGNFCLFLNNIENVYPMKLKMILCM